MRSSLFEDDPKDRKRRFLLGLNVLLGYGSSLDKDLEIKEARRIKISEFRSRLARIYCLEFTQDEIRNMEERNITTGDFTEKYCGVIYGDRGDVDFNALIGNSMILIDGHPAINIKEMDEAPKYGMNGSEWCDVADGPCSCGAWHN